MALERYDGIVQNTDGEVRPGVSITVRIKSTGVAATLYSENTGTTTKNNPLTSDGDGRFWFYAAKDNYIITTPEDELSDVQLAGGVSTEEIVRKLDDLPTKNNDTTLEDDSTLAFSVGANETWEFKIIGLVTTSVTAGFKWTFTIPAGGTYSVGTDSIWDGTTLRYMNSQALTTTRIYSGGVAALASDTLMVEGLIVNGATAGTVQLQYAQATGNLNDTEILTGSYLVARKIS